MSEQEIKKSPVVWMTVYEAAVKQGDAATAARARSELEKAGIVIMPRKEATPCK